MYKNNQKGFTLVELLVVMAIIALLIGLALAGLNIARQNQRDTARRAVLDDLRTGLEQYYGQNGVYPTQGAAAITVSNNPANETMTVGGGQALNENSSNLKGTWAMNATGAGSTCTGATETAGSGNVTMCYADNSSAGNTSYSIDIRLEGATTAACLTGGLTTGGGVVVACR